MQLHPKIKKYKAMLENNLVMKGTFILTFTGFATRIIGFYNRIFLSQLIGAKELGIYQLILPLYMVAFSLTTFGNELALTKIISEYKSRCDAKSISRFFKICFLLNLVLGCIVSTIMYTNANWLCTNILNAPECSKCLQIICLGIPFMSMKGAILGYFLGFEKSGVRGFSDFLEQTFKILSLYLIAQYICIYKHYDAAFAVLGIVCGEFISFLFSFIALIIDLKKKQTICPNHTYTKKPIHMTKAIKLFFKDSIPLTTNRLAITILQSIEAIMIPTVLLSYYKDSSLSLSMYGIFTGMAFPFIMFPATITNSLSTMLLPAISGANSRLASTYLKNLCEKSISFCLLIGIYAATVFYIWGPDIGICLFNNKDAGYYLYQLALLCPFIYLATSLASMLNGLGYATHNLIFTTLATIIRITSIQLLIPKFGLFGYVIGLFSSYLFLTLICLHKIEKKIPIALQTKNMIFIPAVIFTLSGILAYGCYKMLLKIAPLIPSFIILLLSIMIHAIITLFPLSMQILKNKNRE